MGEGEIWGRLKFCSDRHPESTNDVCVGSGARIRRENSAAVGGSCRRAGGLDQRERIRERRGEAFRHGGTRQQQH